MCLSGCSDSSSHARSVEGGKSEKPGLPWFEEVAAKSGIDFRHESGHVYPNYFFPEAVAPGAALFDADQDGFLDVYLVQSGGILKAEDERPPGRMYRNRGDGTFEAVPEEHGAPNRGFGIGVSTGDYDNDGDLDLYVTNLHANAFFRNDSSPGEIRFTDVTAETGTAGNEFSTSTAFLDYDHDGDLDLFVVNDIHWSAETENECLIQSGERDYCGPHSYNAPTASVLYRNNGDGTFTDVSFETGIRGAFGNGLGIVCADFNGDGWIDIYVANDKTDNHLWLSNGDASALRFTNVAFETGCAIDSEGQAKASMGVDAQDIDDDGDRDILTVNLDSEADSLFRNEGGYFVDDTAFTGLAAITRSFTRFGMAWSDLNNDGWLDLYMANGRVLRPGSLRWGSKNPYAEPNVLIRGSPEGRYQEVKPLGGTRDLLVANSRAAAFGDIDNDGGVDILVANSDHPPYLLRNVAPDRGNWIMFRVLNRHGGDAIGATVRLKLGDRTLTRDVRTAFSYCSANDPRVHLGLGHAAGVADVSVTWVDRSVESFGDFEGGRIVELRQGGGGGSPQ